MGYLDRILGIEEKEEERPKYKGGRWLARIEDLPQPYNEKTDQLIRILNKLKEITRNPNGWSVSNENEKSYDGSSKWVTTIANKKGFKIRKWFDCGPEGEYYYGDEIIEIWKDEIIIDRVNVRLSNDLWCSSERKETEEAKIIRNLEQALSKPIKDKAEKLRKEFYK